MFFREPGQLLRIFADLEESSLFLIQNCQETEEGLEELRQKFAEAEVTMFDFLPSCFAIRCSDGFLILVL